MRQIDLSSNQKMFPPCVCLVLLSQKQKLNGPVSRLATSWINYVLTLWIVLTHVCQVLLALKQKPDRTMITLATTAVCMMILL
jgi:hypothetical protein